MLTQASTLLNFTLHATDGDVGSLDDFYFDDREWVVRYLVADTGTWLSGRQVLISPASLRQIDSHARGIFVNLTRKQIEDSPPVATDEAVSRQREHELAAYYSWPPYWYGAAAWPVPAYAPPVLPPIPATAASEADAEAARGDPHLRGVRAISGYHIAATDGELGHAEDFIIDDDGWPIRYMVVDTRNWWPGKKVLVSPHWISNISWDHARISVSLARQTIKTAPEYNADAPLDRGFEERLFAHYGERPYWEAASTSAPVRSASEA